MPNLIVIYIESQKDLFEQLKVHFETLFKNAGYQATIHPAHDESEARKQIQKCDPDVVISDLSFGGLNTGLLIIRNIRRDFPDLYYIGTSRAEYSPRDVSARQPSFQQFADKDALIEGNEKYIKRFADDFRALFKKNIGFELKELPPSIADDFRSWGEKRELRSLLRQVTFTDHASDPLLNPTAARLLPLSGGFSGSFVYRLEAFNESSSISCVPAVLKISSYEQAQKELRNYNKYVKWGLPYIWRVDVLGYGETKKFGAICYSFVLSGSTKFVSLTQHLIDSDDEQIRNALNTIFSPNMRRWYGDELLQEEININQRYSSRYFRGEDSKTLSNDRFLKSIAEMFASPVTKTEFKIGNEKYQRPIERLFGTPNGKYLSCICHGDLNSNNLIVAENGQIIFIDFQETGRGHVFEDFITMEASIRLYYGGFRTMSPSELLHQEKILKAGTDVSDLSSGHKLMAQIRRLAIQNFPREPMKNYYYGVAAFSFRLLRAELSGEQYKRCVCATIGALHCLDE